MKSAIKAYWAPGLFFEELDLAYVGVVDGHDVGALRRALTGALDADRPVVVHIHTVKGKGFEPAEEGGLEGMEKWHAAKPGSIVNGKPAPKKPEPKPVPVSESDSPEKIEKLEKPPPKAPPQYTAVFADALVEEAKNDPRVIGITAAMAGGTGLNKLCEALPEQYYDVGIAEQDAVLFASGLALQGAKPVCAIYSTFLQRAFDQLVHDVCLQELNVVFAMDRAGLVGDDGPTHHGSLRRLLLPPAAKRRGDGAPRRGDARPHAADRARLRRWPDRLPLSARRRRGRADAGRAARRSRSERASTCCRANGWRCSAMATAFRWRYAPPRSSVTAASSRPSPTAASPSHSTPSSPRSSPPTTTCW